MHCAVVLTENITESGKIRTVDMRVEISACTKRMMRVSRTENGMTAVVLA